MAGDFDFLHIKRRTAGSSNELSFDVLDAARDELESGKGRRPSHVTTSSSRANQGNYHGVAGTSTLSAVPEVERRKRVRRARSIRLWAAAVVVIAALVGSAAYFGYRFYQEKVDFAGHFNALVGQFVEIDRTLVNIDTFVQSPLSPGDIEQINDMRDQAAPLIARLSDISSEAQDMKEPARFDADLAALGEIQVAAQAREELIHAANDILSLASDVQREIDRATEAWNKVIDADQRAREASMEANSATTEEATVSARDATSEALAELGEVTTALETLEKEDRRLSFNDQLAYIEVRSAALRSAVETSDALLSNDRAAATSANDAYNTKEREAAKLASMLPAIIGDQVEAAYETDFQKLEEAYQAARAHVSNADADLRGKTNLASA